MRIFYLILACLAAVSAMAAEIVFSRDTLTIGTRQYTIELAETPQQQAQGLMFRTSLPSNAGMLFVPPEETVMTMWMKNTQIPLDMLFIDRGGIIIHIEENTTPQSLAVISAGKPVRAVLELAGGTARANGIKPGDHVNHRLFAPPL